MKTRAFKGWLIFWGLFAQLALAGPQFYRIIDGPYPGPEEHAFNQYTYGSQILYTGGVIPAFGPDLVDGIVWQDELDQARFFLGTENPAIGHPDQLREFEDDKESEANRLMAVIPENFPKTENLGKVIREFGGKPTLEQLRALLSQRYPDGFFIKPRSGFNSDGRFPSEKGGWGEAYRGYLADVKPKIRDLADAGLDATDIHNKLRLEKHYPGKIIEALIESPESLVIQQKIRPAYGSKGMIMEFRVHTTKGKVREDSTHHRWEDLRAVEPELITEVNSFAQFVVDRMDPEMKDLGLALDVMMDENGKYWIIETNVTGSGYHYPNEDVWTTNSLAAFFMGTTELFDEFKLFAAATSLAEKDRLLAQLQARPALQRLVTKETSGLVQFHIQAKNVFMKYLKEMPTRNHALPVVEIMKKQGLIYTLSARDVEFLAQRLGKTAGGLGMKSGEIAKLLGVESGEYLVISKGESAFSGTAHLLWNLQYGDEDVIRRIADRFRGVTLASSRPVEKAIQETVLTFGQLRNKGDLVSMVSRSGKDLGEKRLFYSGTQMGLRERVFAALSNSRHAACEVLMTKQ